MRWQVLAIEPSKNPSRTLTWKPLVFLRHIKCRTNDDHFSASQWESFISSSETLAFSDVIISVHLIHIRDCWLLLVKPSDVWQCLKELDSTCDRESALWTYVYQTRLTVTSNPVTVGVPVSERDNLVRYISTDSRHQPVWSHWWVCMCQSQPPISVGVTEV